ncbi:FIG00388958: hypothetical protein [hydrothermal vent metagenome]|uniref:Protein kinase domain-containing protein n=1 Tax=hydrothermal vent metagenome TaxID=652676 RepID=A0A3B1E6I0_9ZZZZ
MIKHKTNPTYRSNFNDFLINIKNYFAKNVKTIHKARNELKIINYNSTDIIVKSFKVPNIINKIAYSYFRHSKAKRSYNNSLSIGDFTPAPIGYIEFYNYGFIKESFFISEQFKYDFTIREPLLDDNFENKNTIFEAFANFTLKLHNNGIYHNDYSPGNILIKKDNDSFIFKIVDINRMKFFNLSQKDRARNFSKLWARDDILMLIVNEYKKHYSCDDNFAKQALYFSRQNKRIKNLKKRLKGIEVVD